MYGSHARPKANFLLKIDGTMSGAYIKKVSGGRRSREKVKHAMGPTQEVAMGLGGKLKYEPISFDCSIAMGEQLLRWLNAAFKNSPEPRSGTILEADHNMVIKREIEFFDAFVSEVTFPAMDASSKEHAYLTVKIQPTRVEYRNVASGGNPEVFQGESKAKNFSCAHFQFDVDGMSADQAQYVTKLDSFTWKANLKEDPLCNQDVPLWAHCGVDPFEFKVTYNPGLQEFFDDWDERFLRQGQAREGQHVGATLQFHDLTGKIISELEFYRVGLASGSQADAEAGSSDLTRSDVDLYASTLELQLDSSEFDATS